MLLRAGHSVLEPPHNRAAYPFTFAYGTRVDGGLVCGIVAEPHADMFVVPPPVLVRDVRQDLIVRDGRIATQHPPRPQMAGDDGIEFGAVEADLREEEQKSDEPDDEAEIGRTSQSYVGVGAERVQIQL